MHETAPTVYRFAAFTWIGCGVLAIVTVIGVTWTIGAALSASSRQMTPFALAWLAVVAWGWYLIVAQVSYEVREWSDGRVTFRSVIREKSTTVNAISTIRRTHRRSLRVEFGGGSTLLPPTGPMLDFARRVEQRNPSAVVREV